MAEAQGETTQNTQNSQGQDVTAKLDDYEKKCQEKDKEIESYKKRVAKLEEDLVKAQKVILQRAKEADEVDSLKTESEKTLTKAKSIIFERTKVIKNQELQIEAYNQQIESLKDVVRITKDLLEIRNLEVKQLETKINCMEEKVKAEKERQDLLHKKLETMIRHNGELKREYETQLCLFSALRERYNERELARDVVDDMRGVKRPEIAPVVNGAESSLNEPGISLESKDETVPDLNALSSPENIVNTSSIASDAKDEANQTVNALESTLNQQSVITENRGEIYPAVTNALESVLIQLAESTGDSTPISTDQEIPLDVPVAEPSVNNTVETPKPE